MKRIVRIVLGLLIILVAGGVSMLLLGERINRASETVPEEGMVFTVNPGEALGSIAQRLATVGAIRSELFLKTLSYAKATQSKFQAGTYRIDRGMSTVAVHDLLVSGREVLVRVTIPEGWNSSQIAARLDERDIVDAEAFIDAVSSAEIAEKYGIPAESVEGYLFPDTYLFALSFPADRVVEVLVERFFAEIDVLLDSDRPDSEELHRQVVLASIIEREYRATDEARLMASVFYNRLELGMKLQSCATVAYVMTEELGLEYPDVLTYDDLEIPSAYNTYWSSGLPPGPIGNPGVTALDAALHPAESDFLYFVLKDSDAGRHEFSRNYADHLSAKNLYVKKS